MKKLKILYLSDSFKNGYRRYVLLNNLTHKFKVSLVALKMAENLKPYLNPEIKVINLNNRSYKIFKLVRIISREDPDILISTSFLADILSYTGSIFLRKLPVMVMKTANLNYLNSKRSWLVGWVLKKYFLNTDSILLSTPAIKKRIQDNFNVPSGKLKVLPDMVDKKLIKKQSREPIEEQKLFKNLEHPVIITVGELDSIKEYLNLGEGFKKFLNNNKRGTLVVIGKGRAGNKFINCSGKLGILKNVVFLGHKTNYYRYMRKADLFVHTFNRGSFPVIILEAMACELPVVAFDYIPGPSQIITNGLNGLLVPPDNSRELFLNMEKILNHSGVYKNIQENARDRLKDFLPEKIIPNYEKYFSDLIGERKKTVLHLTTDLSKGRSEFFEKVIVKTDSDCKHVVVILSNLKYNSTLFKKNNIDIKQLSSFFKMIRYVKKLQPAMIHTGFLKANFYGFIIAVLLAIPVVYSKGSIDKAVQNIRIKN